MVRASTTSRPGKCQGTARSGSLVETNDSRRTADRTATVSSPWARARGFAPSSLLLSGFAVLCFLGANSPEIFHRAVYTIFDGPLFRAAEDRDLLDIARSRSSAFLSQCQVSKLEPARALFHGPGLAFHFWRAAQDRRNFEEELRDLQ